MGLCLRRLVLQYPWRGGRFQPESVVAFNRNEWQPSPGIGGRFRPELVATFARNTQVLCVPKLPRSIYRTLSRVKPGEGAASLLAVTGLIACKDASFVEAFSCAWTPPSTFYTLL